MPQTIAIIGAGAAGYYAANHILEHAGFKVILIEKSNKVLSKVRISGGGRCNVTNREENPSKLSQNYPRGGKKLVPCFKVHGSAETKAWYTTKGLALKVEDDGRVFPVSDNSQDVIDVLRGIDRNPNFELKLSETVEQINTTAAGYSLKTSENTYEVDKVIVATGGSISLDKLSFLEGYSLEFANAFPSLFTLKIDDAELHKLSGLSFPNAICRLLGEKKMVTNGPLLITHWGVSGPAVLKLSAFGAQKFQALDYKCQVSINSLGIGSRPEVETLLAEVLQDNAKKKVGNLAIGDLPKRYWMYLLEKAEISPEKLALDVGQKDQNKLIELLFNQVFEVNGKTTFKEEFVSGGGVALSNLNMQSFESRNYPGLFFCGEVCNVDGVTGGFNFQFAWTSAYLAAKAIVEGAT